MTNAKSNGLSGTNYIPDSQDQAKPDRRTAPADKKEWEKAEEMLSQIESEVASDDGKPVTLDIDEETSKHIKVRMDARVLKLIDAKDARRERLEQVRANHRNFNRTLTLVLTIVLGLVITWTLPHFGHLGKVLQPYSFIITITMDLLVTGWAYMKHY